MLPLEPSARSSHIRTDNSFFVPPLLPMIVCSCNVFSDHDVRNAVTAPDAPRTTSQVYGCLGCSAQCGRCARTIKRIMDEALSGAGCAACPLSTRNGR